MKKPYSLDQATGLTASGLQLVPFQWNRKMSIGLERETSN